MKLSQEKIDKINEALLIAFVVSLLLFLALRILPGVWGMDTSVRAYKIVLDIFITLSVISFIGTIISGIFATDEDKKRMKEAWQEFELEKKAKAKASRNEVVVQCPLIDLSDNQKEAVIELLKKRIVHHEKDIKRFDRSLVYRYLSALRSMHKIEPVKSQEDKDARRMWIEQITGFNEPEEEWAHFRGDYDEFKKNSKVRDAVKELEGVIEKAR